MQTTQWGPSGWNLFHTLANTYPLQPTHTQQQLYLQFYLHLAHILPCKYCRQSYQHYLQLIPIQPYLTNRNQLMYWTYLIHNQVNNKLRNQGYSILPNPSYPTIQHNWKNTLPTSFSLAHQLFHWIFLYCIVFNYPEKPSTHIRSIYQRFFTLLLSLLSYTLEKKKFRQYMKQFPLKTYGLSCRQNLVYWTYGLHRALTPPSQLHDIPSFPLLCQSFETLRAGCGKPSSHLGPSCRTPLSKRQFHKNILSYQMILY